MACRYSDESLVFDLNLPFLFKLIIGFIKVIPLNITARYQVSLIIIIIILTTLDSISKIIVGYLQIIVGILI